MGYGRYSQQAHEAITRPRSQTPRAQVFRQQRCHPLMNPKGVHLRECRDSESHPASLGIIFAMDVSGSMGEIPHRMATDTLPRFMGATERARIRDAQLMFMAVGHAGGDEAALQVGQFESTASLIDRWLTSMYLEGGGGTGNESYELAMYFVARHVALDSVSQRGQRGFMFITGDAPPNPAVSHAQVHQLIGDELAADIPIRQLLTELQQLVEPFFLIPDPEVALSIERSWRDLLGDRVVVMGHPDDTADVAAGLIALLQGTASSLDDLIRRHIEAGMPHEQAARIGRALLGFASSIGRDNAPEVSNGAVTLPVHDAPSGLLR